MHWFDRLALGAASPDAAARPELTRRATLKIAAGAALSAVPFAGIVARAGASPPTARVAQDPCTDCKQTVTARVAAGTANCKLSFKLGLVSPVFAALGVACTLLLFGQVEVEGLPCLLGPCAGSPGAGSGGGGGTIPPPGKPKCDPMAEIQCGDICCNATGHPECCFCPKIGMYQCCASGSNCGCCGR